MSTNVRIRKLPGAELFAAEFPARVGRLGFRELAIRIEHGQRAGLLPGAHKDPFDRMLIAQAQAENMPIVSDERILTITTSAASGKSRASHHSIRTPFQPP